MALRLGMLKCAAEGNNGCRLGIRKWTHVVAMAPPLDGALESSIAAPQFTLPEFDANQDTSKNSSDFGFTFPGFSFGGSMELMAVPKRKFIYDALSDVLMPKFITYIRRVSFFLGDFDAIISLVPYFERDKVDRILSDVSPFYIGGFALSNQCWPEEFLSCEVTPHKRGVVVKLSCHTSTVAVETGGRMVSEIIEQSG
ncbi:hypothetical protein POTOM_036424 [Populus tomentosa]|uniref:Uncharacterized protein n=1 Tax=Populus tomentosa TaxID=118781 RepID=A0A8X7YW33_POPTO|nr:hypothetical protein POTOM_036424 [Populus tomentosa]